MFVTMSDFTDNGLKYENISVEYKLYKNLNGSYHFHNGKIHQGTHNLATDMHNDTDPLDFEVQLHINRNFEWKSYCGSIGLNSATVYDILDKILFYIEIAQVLMISTLIQLIITSFIINFLVFIPVAKAYCNCGCCGNRKIHRKMLYD